ncbi:LytTR family DNA-binding domain-containing protein [Faecalicatena contorta]|nr:LytTR family DNA-binding domain-containing protein [Faecalicatena contorta]
MEDIVSQKHDNLRRVKEKYMKIIIDEVKETQEEYILFHIREMDMKVSNAIHYLENMDTFLVGKADEKFYKVKFKDLYYIETVDKKTFLYTNENVLESSEKLYQLEKKLQFADFVRVSKSMILNIDMIELVYPTISGRFEAKLLNQEVVAISRSYVPGLKKKLGLGRD